MTNTGNSGLGSLRQAILDANAAAGADVIQFNIAGPGVQTIRPLSALPTLTGPTTVDGWSQPGFAGVPLIELDGSTAGPASGLIVSGGTSVVRGLVINRFTGCGVVLNSSNNAVEGNYIGVDATGTAARGNGAHGVCLEGSSNNRIGTNGDGVNDLAERNVISASGDSGVGVQFSSSADNVIAGNYLGTDATGTLALPNFHYGVAIYNGTPQRTRIGTNADGVADAAERNVISGNSVAALLLSGNQHVVAGNYLGTNAAGTAALPNGSGMFISGSGTRIGTDGLKGARNAAERNVIAGNAFLGVLIEAGGTQTVVAGNFIGTNAAGTAALPNGTDGVWINSGANNNRVGTNGDGVGDGDERNIISASGRVGIVISGSGTDNNVVAGNHLGTDVTGTVALGNTFEGVLIVNAARFNRIGTNADGVADGDERNVISANGGAGVALSGAGTGNVIAGNFVGTNAAGTAALGNMFRGVYVVNTPGTRIGGTAPAARNVISGQRNWEGIGLWDGTTGTVVQGNIIGLDVTGTSVVANQNAAGVYVQNAPNNTVGGNVAGARNLISGNTVQGVRILGAGSFGNLVQGNYIGTDVTGTLERGNLNAGVVLDNSAHDNVIGTNGDGVDDLAEGNLIAGNREDGVAIAGVGTDDNVVAGNYIGTNAAGSAALGNRSRSVAIVDGAKRNRVGPGNVIAYSPVAAVSVSGSTTTGNSIRANTFVANAGALIALPGGGNASQVAPALNYVAQGDSTTIRGTIPGPPGAAFTLDFYAAGGARYLGSATVTANAAGLGSFDATLLAATNPLESVAATATSAANNTSAFSAALRVNRVPLAEPLPEQVVNEGVAHAFSLAASDPDGDALAYALAPGFPRGVGINASTGAVTWAPDYTQSGTYTVDVIVTDSFGGSTTRAVTIRVLDVPLAVNVTAQVRLAMTGMSRDARTGRVKHTLTLVNTGGTALTGPISLVLDRLTPGVTLVNKTGATSVVGTPGCPYSNFRLPLGILAPGNSLSLTLEFENPLNIAFGYSRRVLAGVGLR